MKQVTIGMFAHVDAGKTTLAEQLLYHTNSIRERGRVDHKDAYLDSHDIERARGITVFADQAVMTYNGATYYLIDTPGHVDFSPEMERAVQVMDYAVLVVSAVEGVQGHTETVWQLLSKHRVPTFFFINKIDRTGADVNRVMEDIQQHLTPDACLMTDSFAGGVAGETLVENLAERDERLLDAFLAGEGDQAFWLQALRDMVKSGRLYPCVSGSALQDTGVKEFLEQLHLLTTVDYDGQAPFGGRVYKIRHDKSGTRLTYIKALSGTLKVREELCYGGGEGPISEKATRLMLVNGSKMQTVDQVSAGDLFAVIGLSEADAGQGVGLYSDKLSYDLVPALTSKVIFSEALPVKDVLKAFRILNAEDPSLNVVWEETLQEIHIHVMGVIQLEVLQQLVKDRFGFDVVFGSPEILYKETISSPVKGYGHFEPLRHYAEVHLLLEPGERGSGITFKNAAHVHDLSIGNQNLIETHLYEREHHGLLTGSPLTDVRITLLTGAAHNEHTHGGDFREATFRALRQGLEKADNLLLEPFYEYKIKVELDHLGKVLSDLQRASGQFDPPQTTQSHAVVTGRVPVATFMDYSTELAAFTHGRGSIQLIFAGYDRCHNERDVIERKGYRKDADPLYTSSSIFCAKGAGYAVPWDEAEAKMHLL
ncbi:TetM/TetW/TetO/TetS family tetracycline resistance ribosomal protection protein [Paenibacillus sp. ATY16]|uniref:GTP-binding protein n=1 Tax=Paenibacillus sp. ATY16 TaxID=1759312 RepID=UPI0020106912|nr:TetM/TetW/TetO/TetS family tetracycline resistance ribosomal protection protein [Paenibacillus sp. ATY16]MCK9857715.1 TetM/TetW/TetO/TetS family tetracycline resistance ribosomal protection protein [Paenibacillus sp. ATY16]